MFIQCKVSSTTSIVILLQIVLIFARKELKTSLEYAMSYRNRTCGIERTLPIDGSHVKGAILAIA